MFKFEDVSLFNVGQMNNFASLLCASVSEVNDDPSKSRSSSATSLIGQLPNGMYYRYSEMSLRLLDQHKDYIRKSRVSGSVKNSLGVGFLALHLNLEVKEETVLAVIVHDKGASVFLRSELANRMIVLEVTNYPVPLRLL